MGAEKNCSKSGGSYVGGLLQLFDWNAKSRKKLFSSKSTIPEQSKQKKRCDGNLPVTQLVLMDEDEMLTGSSIKGSSDYSCASSVTDDEFGGARAPGVVARLMGLDSMPTSNFPDPYSTPYFDSQSLQDTHFCSRNLAVNSYHRLNHSGNLHEKMEAPVRNILEPKNLRIYSRPIEKFQTEILPPKSAKSIPITHHKLLSPIKSANFIPSENAAHIMEAAARIIGPAPQATTRKAKVPTVGSCSVPLKVRELKEKVEAAQKPLKLNEASRRSGESNAFKYLKGQPVNKSWNGSTDTLSARASSDAEECSSSTKGKGKTISLALQAKANVQKREGINPIGSRNYVGQKELNEVISTELFKSQPSTQKSTHKKPSTHGPSSNVLRQNNQKQNCLVDKGKLPSKPSISKSQGRKPVNGDSSFVRYKSSSKSALNSKAVSRRSSNSEVTDAKREDSSSNTRNINRKKRSIDGNFHLEKPLNADKMWNNTSEKLIQSSLSTDREISKRIGTDVVSFTFTAPMTRSLAGPESCREVAEKSGAFASDYRSKGSLFIPNDVDSSKSSLLGNNVIGGDALSTLLEQKLRELTREVETSCNKAGNGGASPPIFQDLRPHVDDALSTTTSFEEHRSQHQMHTDEVVSQFSSGFSSTDLQGFIMKHKFQGMDHAMNKYHRNDIEAKKLLDCRLTSTLSVLEHSPFGESCNSSDTADSISTGGSKQSSSVQAQEVFGISFSKFSPSDADAELSDSASSLSSRTTASKQLITLTSTDPKESTEWELEYVNEILCNIELMFKDFAMGRAREIINPHLFDQLESRKRVFDGHESSKLRRKVLFDCVTEWLDIRCRRYASGGYETWIRGLSVVKSKERLAEEVYREISGWSGMSDSMVDELVDKDMSNKYGRWLDFEIEAFELGVQIESRILNHLLDEVIADML